MRDPRPPKRIQDLDLMRRFHLEMQGEPCQDCERRVGNQIHHLVFRSQGGGDVRENFRWVCQPCSDARHGI